MTISGTYSYSGTIDNITAYLSENGVHPKEFAAVMNGKNFAVEMTELSPGTTYQYYYSVDYGSAKPFKTGTRSFTTKSETPTVKALEILKIDSTTFRIKCEAFSDGGQEVTERGIYWNTYGDPTIGDNTIKSAESGLGIYTIRMENLAMGKKYFVRAYAKNAAGIGLSEEVLEFETEASAGASVDIELSFNPEEGGTVNGGGSYEVGTQCTATAVANTGYTFVNWTENDIQVSSNAEYTFTVTTGRNLVANFTKQAYVITAQVDPEDSGTVTGAGGYNYSEECTLTATAKTGYDFVKWTKGNTTVSTDAEYSFTVTSTATYVAHFSIKSYSVNVSANPTNGGTVSGGGTFNYGESHTVHATPADGFAFTNWTDDGDEVSTDADYTFTVSSNRNLVANFTVLQPDEYSITVSANPSEGGTVTGSGTYQQGQSCTVKATSKPNFIFVNWTENGNQVSDLAEYTFTVTGNRVLVANFEAQAPTEYTVSVSANPSNGGTVAGGGTYEQGEQCRVTATANEGYTFTNWTEGGNVVSTQSSYTFTVNSDRNLVANFSQQSYTINASASPSNGGTVAGAGIYNYGQSCPLSATAASGYTFTNWTENGNVVSTNANYTFTVTGNRTLVANFTVQAPNTYNINVSANPPEGGTVTGGGSYTQGEQCTVSATENNGYTFLRWTENGNQVSTQASYTFTVTGNRTLVAQFQVQSYTISVSANPSNGGTVTGGGTYNHGQQCNVTATPNSGYTFVRWTENGSQVSTNPSYTFTVTGNRTLVAQFQQQTYTITATANPTNGGTISGNQSPYTYGQTCNLTATPASNYTFTNWTENGNVVSTNATYSFQVTSNRTLVANFTYIPPTYTITVSANPSNGGTAHVGSTTGPTSGTFTQGQSCTIYATANEHYTFTNWKKGNSVVSTNPSYTFQVTESASYTAYFTQDPQYTITVIANPTNGGSVSGGGTYYAGTTINLTANANSGFTFDHWQDGNTNNPRSITVMGNATYTAYFTAQPQVPQGAINGQFTINSNGDKVYFSKGNLQYNKTTQVWSFMEHQYDMVETQNQNVGENYANQNIVSLFGWGTSGYHDSNDPYNVNYQPWSTSCSIVNQDYNYYGYGPSTNMPSPTLTGSSANYDWGVNNTVYSGSIATTGWRTLTGGVYENNSEWSYIFRGRTTVSGILYAKAQVAGVNGVILLPDDWSISYYSLESTNIHDASFSANVINAQQWGTLEQHGAVFLPAAGIRDYNYMTSDMTSVCYVGSYGRYWSTSSHTGPNQCRLAWGVYFNDAELLLYNYNFNRCTGFTVRLVCPCR